MAQKKKTPIKKPDTRSIVDIRAERLAKREAFLAKNRKPKTEVYTPPEVVKDPTQTIKSVLSIANAPVELCTIKDNKNSLIKGYMGVRNLSKNKIVSVVSDTYKLLPNKSIIDPVLNFFEKENLKYSFDKFTWVTERRMRLHFTFPDYKIKDDTKDGILSSIFMHNSYDMIESFRLEVGAMRQVCSNGMVIGKLLKRLKMVHKAEFIEEKAVGNIISIINGFYDNNTAVEAYIKQMIDEKTTLKFLVKLSSKVEHKIFSHLIKTIGLAEPDDANRNVVKEMKNLDPAMVVLQSHWEVYNILTQYISHHIVQRYRVDYLRRVSRFFGL